MPASKIKTPAKKTNVKVATAKVTPAPKTVAKASGLSVASLSLTGKSAGTLSLPKEIFGAKVNKFLVAQAVRVYLNNAAGHYADTKTRGEVEGSTRKIFKQKGTGRARHGAIRAPIFVGGGIALGPRSRKVILELPQKMRNAALISALSEKTGGGDVQGISGLDKATGKTKEIVTLFKSLNKKSVLLVVDGKMDQAKRASKNIKNLSFLTADELNALEVIKHQSLIFTKEAVEKLEKRLLKKSFDSAQAIGSEAEPQAQARRDKEEKQNA